MIFIDDRAGSKELIVPLSHMGLPVHATTLAFGDLAFTGRGDGGVPVEIGVEFKTLQECVGSLRSARLQGFQLPGMREIDPDTGQPRYHHCWLLIEGEVLYNAKGLLHQRNGPRHFKPLPGTITIGEFEERLNTFHMLGGITPVIRRTRHDSLKWIEAQYRWWTDRDLNEHTSHIGMYRAPPLVPISEFRTFVYGLPGIGVRASKAVETRFGSIRGAINATPEEWAAVEVVGDNGKPKRLGTKVAAQIHAFVTKEYV